MKEDEFKIGDFVKLNPNDWDFRNGSELRGIVFQTQDGTYIGKQVVRIAWLNWKLYFENDNLRWYEAEEIMKA
jgi:hypothetical protein